MLIMADVVWTEELKTRLRELHADEDLLFGAIAAQLSQEFGVTLTRNACIGKAGRMRLVRRHPRPPQTRRRAITLGMPPETVPRVLPRWRVCEPPAPPAGERLTLLQLTDNTCRWPYGDRVPYLFCGAATAGKTYCAYHTGVACGHRIDARPSRRPETVR